MLRESFPEGGTETKRLSSRVVRDNNEAEVLVLQEEGRDAPSSKEEVLVLGIFVGYVRMFVWPSGPWR